MVVNDPAKGEAYYAFASTDQSDLTFQGDRTFGANWRAEGYAQGFAVTLGGRPRSFWKVTEVETVDFKDNADNTAAITAAVGAGKNAVVTRAMKAGMWNTLVVPHAMNTQAIIRNFGDGAQVARFESETADGVIHFVSVGDIEAGIPYLVMPTFDVVNIITMNTTISAGLTADEGIDYDFVGIYAPLTLATADYYVAAGNALKRNTAASQMPAFRAYFRHKTADVKQLVALDIDGITTAISLTTAPTSVGEGAIYNLSGQRLRHLRRGVNIVNGRKVIVK